MDKQKAIDVLKMVMQDVENDARAFEGKPFTVRNVSEYLGNHGAAIAAIANILREALQEES